MQRKRTLKIGIIIVLAAVLIFHAVWLINFLRYRPFVSRIPKDEIGNRGYVDEDRTAYSAYYPHYLEFTGNLAITQVRNTEQKPGDRYIDMIIWPQPFRNHYKFGVTVSTVTNVGTDGSFTVDNTRFVMDEKKNFLKEPYEEELEVFREFESVIDQYYEKANQMWGILNPKQ